MLYAGENEQTILFAQNGNLYLLSVNINSEPELLLGYEDWYIQFPSWSPDGTQIAFSAILPNYATAAVNGEIFIANNDGSMMEQLTNNDANNIYPLWSPDGAQIAFTSDLDGDWEIYTINVDGSNLTKITDNDADDGGHNGFTWSPDGQYIAYVSDQNNRAQFDDGSIGVLSENIYVVDTHDTSSLINLTQGISECGAGNFYKNPVWSRNENQLFFAFSCGSAWNIYRLDMISTLDALDIPSYERVTNDLDRYHGREGLDISSDGSSIVFISSNAWRFEQPEGIENIFVFNIDEPAAQMIMLTENSDERISYESPRWRPIPTE